VYAIGIPGAILLCLGVPVSTLCIMLSIRKRLRQPRTTATFGFLYHQFKCAGHLQCYESSFMKRYGHARRPFQL